MEEIDIKEFLKSYAQRWYIIAIAVVLCASIGVTYSKMFKEQKYTATATMLLAKSSEAVNSGTVDIQGITTTDITINNQLIATYQVLAQSSNVVREVLDNLSLTDVNENQLKSMIKVTSKTGTQVIQVSVTDTNPYRATRIANELTNVFIKQIKEWYKMDNINIVDQAEQPEYPSNINTKKTFAISAGIGLVLSVGILTLIKLLDNTINSAKDIERELGLPVLSELPLVKFN